LYNIRVSSYRNDIDINLINFNFTDNRNPEIIRLGDQNLVDPNDGAQPEDFGVSNVIVHPEYNKRSTYNDIALIRLNRKARLEINIKLC